MKMSLKTHIVAIGGIFLLSVACSTANSSDEPIILIDLDASKSRKLTNFELDVAFRQQAIEDLKAFGGGSKYSACCVLFYSDIEMISKIVAHLTENTNAEIENYGISIEESATQYLVTFTERFKNETQYEVGGRWYPGIGDPGLLVYRYYVDRNSLEILHFVIEPS